MAIYSGGDGAQAYAGTASDDIIYGHSNADTNPLSGQIIATRVVPAAAGLVFAGSTTSDANGLYTLNKADGTIIRTDLSTGTQSTFLDIPNASFSSDGERGLLGLAFHPDYATNGRYFVFVNAPNGDLQVVEYHRSTGNPLVSDATPVKTIITIPHSTFSNHNGGSLAFGPDGNLYISTGDGGSGNDPDNNAQNINVLLGKILRLDVNSDGFPADDTRNYAIPSGNVFAASAGADEIYDYGLRNPWRVSFDSLTGDLWIGDVGQSAQEEIDVHRAGVASGLNFGWRIYEGTLPNIGTGPGPFEAPVQTFGRLDAQSITGGYVNRGPGAGLQGDYVFGDFITGKIWALLQNNGTLELVDLTSRIDSAGIAISSITSFGRGSDGALFVVTYGDGVFRLDFSAASGDGNDSLSGGGGSDAIYGGAGDDWLSGDSGNDTLLGGLGTDILDGGTGADTMLGGNGNDLYIVDAIGDYVSEANGAGTDTVRTTLANYTLGDGFENLEALGGSTFYGLGNALNNVMSSGSGADGLYGGAGNDLLFGGVGNDVLVGNDYTSAVTGFDGLYGGEGNDTLFIGLAGNAYMDGGAGNDIFYGGLSNDTLRGGTGNDFLYGNAGTDYFLFYQTDFIAGDADLVYFVDAGDRLKFSASMNGSLFFQDLVLSYDGNPLHTTNCVYITDFLGGGQTAHITVYGTTVAALAAQVDYTL